MDTLSYILDWIHGFLYFMIIPTVCITAWCIVDRVMERPRRKSHHDSYPGSFWYNSHRKENK